MTANLMGTPRSNNAAAKFPNPFFDIASTYVPSEITEVLEWAEYLYMTMGTYRSATRRLVRYFLTEVVLDGESDDERDKFEDFLNNKLHILTELAHIGDEYMTYGNVFVSLYFPFDRFLICPKCQTQYRDSFINYKFTRDSEFTATCNKCKYTGAFEHQDRRSPDVDRVKIIRWNPKDIKLRAHPVSGRIQYYWQMPQDFIKKLADGNKFYVEDTPWAMLECVKDALNGGSQYLFKFNKDSIYHMKEGTLSGLPISGWGVPPILPNFKLAYYIQVLRRYDEAIAFDYIVPFRVMYPDAGPSNTQDPVMTSNLGNFQAQLKRMVKDRRSDPTQVQIAPYKVGYQMIGGEGRSIAPKESIKFAVEELLNGLGYPAELYQGTLGIQAAPMALRLFENSWSTLVDGYNDVTTWLTTRLSKHFMWGDITGTLRSVTLADDMERKSLALQAAAGMDISKSTAYRPFGIDFMDEQRKVVDEQQAVQGLQQKAMDEAEATKGLEGSEGGGGGPGGDAGATPGDVQDQAKQLAQQLLLQTPETSRRGELLKIKHSNPTLHALVKQEMAQMRQDMSSQGQTQVMEQAKAEMQGNGGG